MRRLTITVASLALALTLVPPAPANADDLAPTWEQEISAAQSDVAAEEGNLREAEAELAEAQAEGDASYVESRQERVDYYSGRVEAARAYVTAAQAGQKKQAELDQAGEPQDDVREYKEVIEYHEVLRDEAQAAGDTVTAEDAQAELEGGTFGSGLYDQQEDAEKVRAAKEAATGAIQEETTAQPATQETTSAAAPPAGAEGGGQGQDGPGGGGLGGGEPAPREPAPQEPAPAPQEPGGINLGSLVAIVAILAAASFVAYRRLRPASGGGLVTGLRRSLGKALSSSLAEAPSQPAPPQPAPASEKKKQGPPEPGSPEPASQVPQGVAPPDALPEPPPSAGLSTRDILERRRRDAEARRSSDPPTASELDDLFFPDDEGRDAQ